MTKFDKWYLETWGSNSEDTDESNKAFCAWQACRKEILNIIARNTTKPNIIHNPQYLPLENIIKEIQEL